MIRGLPKFQGPMRSRSWLAIEEFAHLASIADGPSITLWSGNTASEHMSELQRWESQFSAPGYLFGAAANSLIDLAAGK
jgi:hypothetical protein